MSRIYDNIESKFVNGLQDLITDVGIKRVDFCVGYFNLRGWDLVVNQIDQIPGEYVYENDKQEFRHCRLLIGMHQPDEELVRQLYSDQVIPDAAYVQQCKLEIARDFRKQLLLGMPTKRDEWTLRRLSAQLKENKVCVKLYVAHPLHAKLYLAYSPDSNRNKISAILGSSNLTYSGLTKNGELDADIENNRDLEALADWFDERWNDRFCIDITKELIDAIDNSWAGEEVIPPYYIYLKTAYHLSADARSGVKEFTMPPEFQRELFDFQQTAVKIAARHLNSDKRGGAMIGDVVGLGKTITACAIAKIYEMTYASSTLIICPASLQDMWDKYRKRYDLQKAAKEKENWFNVEEEIYHFVHEKTSLNDAQIGLIRLQFDILKKYLRKYLQNESEHFKPNENSLALDLSKRLVMSENYIYTLSFNYTDCYDLCRLPKPKGRSLLVHGGLNQSNIELGCREIENKKRNLQLDFMYKPHINLLSEIFLQNLETASEVIFFGHSLNRLDYCYFKDYFENLEGGRKEDKHLTIICKNLVSENQIKKELAYNISLSKIEKNIDLQFIYTDDRKEDNPQYHQLCERLNAY